MEGSVGEGWGGMCFFMHILGGGSWRHGAAEAGRQMCRDGHTQEVDAVWRRGGVGGSETWQGVFSSIALKMDWWQVAVAASYLAGGRVEEHAGLVGAHTRQASRLGPQVLDVRFGCEVCLVLGPDHQRPFIS